MEEAVRVVGVRGDTAAPRPQRADDRYCPEQVLGQPVDAAAELRLDAVHDRGRVGRDRARVIGDEQGAAGLGQAVEVLPLDPEPVLVERVVEPAGHLPEVLAAAPGVDVGPARVGPALDAGQPARDRDEVAGPLGDVGLGHQVEVGALRSADARAVGGTFGHPGSLFAHLRSRRGEVSQAGGSLPSDGPYVDRTLRPGCPPPRRGGAGGRIDGPGVPVAAASPRSPAHDPSAPGRPGSRSRAARPRVRRRARRHGRRGRRRESPARSRRAAHPPCLARRARVGARGSTGRGLAFPEARVAERQTQAA